MFAIEPGTGTFGSVIFLPQDERLGLPTDPVHLRTRDVSAHKEFNANLEQLQRELDSERPGQDRAAFAYAALLGVWLDRQHAEEAAAQYSDAATRLVARYTRLIENKYPTGHNVQHYATALGVTATHLTRVCNQVSGQPASQVLNDRVMYEARRLLRDTKEPVNAIAKSLGFSTPAYFTRAFQSHSTMTPSAYRNGAHI
nr:AraC family transcriptional regulator [Sulfitobacter algicola]